jgi:tripartite-type tricarboxylate transporter receptor subunit TctC
MPKGLPGGVRIGGSEMYCVNEFKRAKTFFHSAADTLLSLACIFGLLAFAAQPASAQDYPTRSVRILVASGAGGVADVFARVLADEIQKSWKQPVVVEDRPGGGFNLAAGDCARAPADGYTICLMPNEVVAYNPFMYKTLPYDPDKSFVPVTRLFFMTQMLAVNPSLHAKTLPQLAATSKAEKGTLSYATPGLAETVFMQKFVTENGADMVRVPFRGSTDAITGMLSGSTPIVFIAVGNLIPYVRNGSATPILVNSAERFSLFPDVPTLRETGYKGDYTLNYFGLFLPAGTPPEIVDKIHRTVIEITRPPKFREKYLNQRGLVPIFDTPDQFKAAIKEDRPIASRIFAASGLRPQ